MAMAGSSYTQKPEARSGMAWCSPPAGLKACSAPPSSTAAAAPREAPTTRAEASCMFAKIGLSPGPNPKRHQSPASPSPARRAASMYRSVWTRPSSSSLATRAGASDAPSRSSP